ncbi:ABC transporter ATP-binding protein [Neorhizobium sp. DAR64861/K0K2]|uniref:ABC transporter ATP-binding protein n=1 Tax=unclassified Neorhizobium TaxID=2629175 RepID=UPI003D296B95
MIIEQIRPSDMLANEAQDDAVLRVEDLSIDLAGKTGALKAINDVNFSIRPGETLALVGESGSGKSLTSLSVLQLLPKTLKTGQGSKIRFRSKDGNFHDLATASPRVMRSIRGRDIGIVFQEPSSSLNPVQRVGEQIAEPIRVHMGLSSRAAWKRAEELLAHVGIPDAPRRALQYPHEFSGGMSQRATIAMALACDPVMLIADEPTTALDVTTQAQILDLMQSLQRERQMAMLFVTHNFAVVAQIAHRVAVMYSGYVVEYGRVDQVFAHPRHPYTAGLLACVAREGEALALRREGKHLPTISGSVPSIANRPQGCPFAPRCPLAIDACRAQVPPLEVTDEGNISRCIRWKEL